MAYWLLKSEPGSWSWDDQVRDSVTEWDGVRNHQANNNMKAMKEGDRCFFYHSVNAKEIVGVVEGGEGALPGPDRPVRALRHGRRQGRGPGGAAGHAETD